jgi:transcriptional regulator with XRE-family HTH domain
MSKDIDASERARPSPRAMALARAIRTARGAMPQLEFVGHANRPQSVVSNWETGRQTPTLESLCALEGSLGLPLGLLAAQAGYFTAEAAEAAGLAGLPISSLSFERRPEALRAVCAADDLGLGVRLVSTGPKGWRVDVLAPQRGEVDGGDEGW